MNTNGNKINGTTKTTTTVIIGAVTLLIGLAIGVTAAESHAGTSVAAKMADGLTNPTNPMSLSPPASPQSANLDEWNPFQDIRDMQAQMNRMFNQMNEQFQGQAGIHGFTDIPGYSLSLDVRDLKNRYEVHAYLPDAKASDVHVSLANNQTLKVEVSSRKTKKSDTTNVASSVTELGQYEQVIQLPTPVKASQMKITRKGHEMVITIPKAASSTSNAT